MPSPKLPLVTLGDMLNQPVAIQKFILPELIPEAGHVCVSVAPDVDALQFATQLAYACAAGLPFRPFGEAQSTVTAAFFPPGMACLVREHFELFANTPQGDEQWGRACTNLHSCTDELSVDLGWSIAQAQLDESLPPNCKLAIYFDVRALFGEKKIGVLDHQAITPHLARLRQRGIATVIFLQRRHRGSAVESELLAGEGYHLALDAAASAPREFGGGYTVHRRKVSEFDTVPRCYLHWYRVKDRRIKFGWEVPSGGPQLSAKQMEIVERRARVEQLKAAGMEQRAIASVLGVDPATISRDVADIRANASMQEHEHDFFDEGIE